MDSWFVTHEVGTVRGIQVCVAKSFGGVKAVKAVMLDTCNGWHDITEPEPCSDAAEKSAEIAASAVFKALEEADLTWRS